MNQSNLLKGHFFSLLLLLACIDQWSSDVLAQASTQLGAYPLTQKSAVSSPFGLRNSPFTGEHETHEGIDIPAQAGSPILATGDGKVTFAGFAPGYGNLVEIDYGQGYTTRYGHAQTLLVKTGDQVKQSEQIATVGSTGRSTGPHLHFEVSLNHTPFDPRLLLGGTYLDHALAPNAILIFTSTKLKAPWQLQQLASGKYQGQILYTSKNTRRSGAPFVIVKSHPSVQ